MGEGTHTSSEPTEAVTHLSDLRLPEVSQLNGMAEDGAGRLLQEIMDAVAAGKSDNDHRPLEMVIDSWYRSLLFWQHDPKKYDDIMTKARRSHPRGELSEDELRARLGS